MATRLPGPPGDQGMQQERTLLSWERTGVALVAAAVTVGRHALGTPGALIAVPCAIVAMCGVWLYLASLREGRLARASHLEPSFDAILRDGRLPTVVAGLMALLCLGEVAAAVNSAGWLTRLGS